MFNLNLKMSRHARLEIVFLFARGSNIKIGKVASRYPRREYDFTPCKPGAVGHPWLVSICTPKGRPRGASEPRPRQAGQLLLGVEKQAGESAILHPEGRNQAARAIPRRACGSVKAELLIKNTR